MLKRKNVFIILTLTLILALFQNCSSEFQGNASQAIQQSSITTPDENSPEKEGLPEEKKVKLLAPINNTTLNSASPLFYWENLDNASKRKFDLLIRSTKPFPTDRYDNENSLYDTINLGAAYDNSSQLPNLPTDGRKLYGILKWSDDEGDFNPVEGNAFIAGRFIFFELTAHTKEIKNEETGAVKLEPTGCVNVPEQPNAVGSVGLDKMKQWFPDSLRYSLAPKYIETITKPQKALRVHMVPYTKGSYRVGGRGDLPSGQRYRLQQTVLFESGWDWVANDRGGKLGFGLGGGSGPAGGIVDPNGWTLRFEFRGHTETQGRIGVYSYEAGRDMSKSKYGIATYNDPKDFLAEINVPITMTMDVTMNSSTTKKDGVLDLYVNGKKLITRTGIAWMTGKKPVIDLIHMAAFYGGNNESWAPSKTTYLQVYDVCWQKIN